MRLSRSAISAVLVRTSASSASVSSRFSVDGLVDEGVDGVLLRLALLAQFEQFFGSHGCDS
jgi:hypothetical protein